MKAVLYAAFLVSGFTVLALAHDQTTESMTLKARVAQLEFQLGQSEAMRAVAQANFAACQEPQKRAKIEEEAGCPNQMDWQAVPPVCKPGNK